MSSDRLWCVGLILVLLLVAVMPTKPLDTFPAKTAVAREGQKQGSHFVDNLPRVAIRGFDTADGSQLGAMLACSNGLVTCDDPADCDCSEKCGGSQDHSPFTVERGRRVQVGGTTLEEGKTYCLPTVRKDCNRRTTKMVLTAAGWQCVNVMPHLYDNYTQVACLHKDEVGLTKNHLYDHVRRRKIDVARDLDFRLEDTDPIDGLPAVRCKCESLNKYGNRTVNMPTVYPYSCVDDPCQAIVSNSGAPGFVSETVGCKCGSLLKNEDPNDPFSPCTPCRTDKIPVRYQDHTQSPVTGERFTLKETCYGAYSPVKFALDYRNPCSFPFFTLNSKTCMSYVLPDYIKGFPKDFSAK